MVTTYKQWHYFKLTRAAAREDARAKQICLNADAFREYLERNESTLDTLWPGIIHEFMKNDKNMNPNFYASTTINRLYYVFKDSDTFERNFVTEEEPKTKENGAKTVMDIQKGDTRMILTSDGKLTVKSRRVYNGIAQTLKEVHPSATLFDMVKAKCPGGFPMFPGPLPTEEDDDEDLNN